MPFPPITLTEDQRRELSNVFLQELTFAASERAELDTRWEKYAELYEARTEQVNSPWPNASGIKLPAAASHADALFARMMNAFFAQDPMWVVLAQNPLFKDFATELQSCWSGFQRIS